MSITIALAGNPNSGKTTLFNALTGANQFVGNWPGVTVEKKEGKLKKNFTGGSTDVTITDLPGIYSLSPYTLEEVVARNYLIQERPDVILNIVDGSNIERNLYLSTQLLELGIPVVMAVNMMDVVKKNGDTIRVEQLSKKLGCDVVEISALKGTGIEQAARKAVDAARKSCEPPVHEFAEDVELAIHSVETMLGTDVPEELKRFFAIKLLERDDKIVDQMKSAPDVEAEIASLEESFDDDVESIITNERYGYITSIIGDCCTKAKTGKMTISDKIDRIVTNRILALPIFALIMIVVYYVSVTSVGTLVTDWTNDGLFGDGWYLAGIGRDDCDAAIDEWASVNVFTDEAKAVVDAAAADANVIGAEELQSAMEEEDFGAFEEAYGSYGEDLAEKGYALDAVLPLDEEGEFDNPVEPADYGIWVPGVGELVGSGLDAIGCAPFLRGLIVDGIVGGVGAVLGFVPQMFVLFIFLAFLEGCGYMARIAFIMDRIFRRFGLSGKSFIPMLIGTGCGVPGVMASRTIENDRDRKMTIMTTTFIPCGAKMPIIALIASALFGGAWWVAPSAYFLGIAAIIMSGIILKKTRLFAGEPAPFVMELPAYHLPTVGSVLRSMWERGWSFIKRAGTIILLASIIIWLGSNFGVQDGSFGFHEGMDLENSILGYVGNAIKWIFAPLGFADIKAAIATVMGLVAKEEVVGVFGVLDFEGMTPIAGYAFLAFNLLCAPCFAAIGAIRREMNNGKWTAFAITYQCVFAYVASLIIYNIGLLCTGVFRVWTVVAFLLIAGLIYLMVRPYKESDTLKLSGKTGFAASK